MNFKITMLSLLLGISAISAYGQESSTEECETLKSLYNSLIVVNLNDYSSVEALIIKDAIEKTYQKWALQCGKQLLANESLHDHIAED